ncbi:MAG: hypothetical protein IT287_02980 [Bdellovibrionaceae bacterium]|nr:hypothetical protein [Pseudobdellovibrionaceae bacterium]
MLDQMSDPDYFYHVALSKQIMTSGFPETVPQVKDIGWDVLFTDKEYLYHVITTLFYSLFGEAGIRATSLIFLAISTCVIFFQSVKNLGWRLFWVPFTIIALDPYFLRRMIMVRPQTLAVMLFVFLLVGFVTKRKYVVLFSSLLFALSYHGLQVPGLLIAASLFTSFVVSPGHIKYAAFCAMGLIAGCLLNPYFPGNLTFLSQITNIVRDTTGAATLQYGGEIYPWVTSEYLNYSFISGAVLALAFSAMGTVGDSQRESDKDDHSLLMFLTVSFCLFLAVSMLTPRGREYLIPTGALLIIQVLRHSPVTGTALVTLMAVVQFFSIQSRFNILFAPGSKEGLAEMFAALDKIPDDDKSHMLNCNWSHAPFIIYKKPNVTFVDIMDPSFLYLANRSLHDARTDMMNGKFPDSRFIMNDVFKAKYMLCENFKVNSAFDMDPHFERLYPETPISKSTSPIALFKLKESSMLPNFQREFLYSLPTSRDQWLPLTAEIKGAKETLPTSYLNFLLQLPKDTLVAKTKDEKERVANCLFLKPKDLAAHIGSEYIGIGGGPNVRLWVNDEALFENNGEPERLKMTDVLVPLPKPLKASDKVVAMVCPGVVQSYFGITMSFWTAPQMQTVCEPRDLKIETTEAPTEWKFKGSQEKNCMAPIASRSRISAAIAEPIKKK